MVLQIGADRLLRYQVKTPDPVLLRIQRSRCPTRLRPRLSLFESRLGEESLKVGSGSVLILAHLLGKTAIR